MRLSGVFLAVVLLLSGCGGHEVDRAQWENDLAAQGVNTSDVDWVKLETLYKDKICKDKADDLSMFIAVGIDQGTDPDEVRASVKNVCPDRLEDLDDAIAEVQGASTNADVACNTPADRRTQDQQDMVEALGC